MVNRRDQRHGECAQLLTSFPGPLLLPEVLLTEIGYLVGTRCGPHVEAAFLPDTVDGAFDVVSLSSTDRSRMAELVGRYADLPLGTADAAVVVVAERFRAVNVATIDRRHFSVVRPNHIPAFAIFP